MTTTGSNSNHNNHHEDGSGRSNNNNSNNNNPSTRSWGTAVSGQSVSTSGSMGSPSSRSEQTTTVATSASDSAFLRLNNLDIQGDDAGSQGASGFKYFQVADELVAEFALPNDDGTSPDQQQYDEKNIRRRVYDALNVLMAMDIISKDKKEIQWRGLPRTSLSDIEELKVSTRYSVCPCSKARLENVPESDFILFFVCRANDSHLGTGLRRRSHIPKNWKNNDIEELKSERLSLRNRIEKKIAYSQELEEQYVGLQNLIQRNEHLYSSGNAPSGGVALPFILVQTRPHATVEVEISEDMQLVHFDFNTTPFELHDDNFVLKTMKFCDQPPQQPNGHNNNQLSSHNFALENSNEGPSTASAMQLEVYQPHLQPQQHELHSQPQIIPTPETNEVASAADTAPVISTSHPGTMNSNMKPEK
ncbi:PREDICTED: transcription factor-like protein DPB [Camelina sativa]|uniref:Transcription factor-like protein DPB n=1 Tax=Camelina sativa TaxID=90675 RepID=A0ABM0Y3X8_CAMSA|nr:PREDICTED: transcription factor-like protein DPB [Camelina sativa]